MKLLSVLIPVGACLSFPTSSFAEPSQIEDPIIVTGSRVPIPLSQITSAISVLDEETLIARGDQFIVDALRQIPSVAVNRSGPSGALTQVRVRGSEANHVLVLIDGMEASDPFTDSFNFAAAASDGVSRIEILRGEQSALWGTDAIGGVIQILTEPLADDSSLRAKLEWGSFDTGSFAVSAAHAKGEQKVWGQVSGLQTQGYDVSGNEGEDDGFSHLTAHGGANVPIADNWHLQLRTRLQTSTSEFDSDTDFDGRLNDVERALDTDLAMGRVALVGHTDFGDLQHEIFSSYLNSQTRSGTSSSDGSRTKVGWQVTGGWRTNAISHRLTGLAEGRFETYENNGGPGAGQNQQQSNDMLAVALDYQGTAGPVVLSLSARHEENQLFANSNAFRAGLAWNIDALSGKFRASVGQGVKNPGFFELFGFFPGFFVGNPDLIAEKSTGFELGWDQHFSKGTASITLFTAQLEDEIFTDFGAFPATARNRSSTSTREGIELSGTFQWTQSLTSTGSVSFLSARENGVQEIRRPEFLASFSLFWSGPSSRWAASLGVDHNGEMQDTDFANFQRVTLAANTLVRARVSRKIGKHFELYLRGENLANTEFEEVVGFAGQERAIYGGVVARF